MFCIVPNKSHLCVVNVNKHCKTSQRETLIKRPQKIIVMKTQTTNFFNELNAKALNELTTEVKETLATNVDSNKSTLKAIDFWNLQRIQKSRTCGRFPGISVR